MSWNQWNRALVVLSVTILGAILLFGAVWLLLRIGGVLLLFLLAGLLAFVLMPLVDTFQRPGVPRPVAVLTAYVCLAVFAGGIGFLVFPTFIDQSTQLAQRLPGMARDIQDPNSALAQTLRSVGLRVNLQELSSSLTSNLQSAGQVLLGDLLGVARQVSTAVVNLVLVLVVAFYLLNEGHELRERLDEAIPRQHHGKLAFFEDTVGRVLGGYLRGQLLVALMVALLAGVACQLVGLRYAVVVGTLAGLFELIPFFGPVLSAIPALLIALFQGPPLLVVGVLVVFVVIQQVESNIIGPRITGHAVGLHPLVVMFSILVGVELAGIWGAIFAVPVAGVFVAIGRKLYAINCTAERTAAKSTT